LSTLSQREQLSPICSKRRDPVDSVALSIVGDSWVASVRVSIATQLNSTHLSSAQLNSTRLTCFALFNWVSCIADHRR